MIQLAYEMTYQVGIEGPLGPTAGSPAGQRSCWQIASATLNGPRIRARLAMPGIDWLRVGPDDLRRPDLRAQLITDDGELVLLQCDTGLIRVSEAFLTALNKGGQTAWDDQYIRIVPTFDTGAKAYAWLTQNLFVGQGRVAGLRRLEYAIYRVL